MGTDEEIHAEFERLGYGKQFGDTVVIDAETKEESLIASSPYVKVDGEIKRREDIEIPKKVTDVEVALEYEKNKVDDKMSYCKYDEYDDDYLKNMLGNLMSEVKKKGILGSRSFFSYADEIVEYKFLIDELEVPYIVGEPKDVSLALQIRGRFINKIGMGEEFDGEEKVALKHLFKVQDSAKFWIENKDTDYRELISPLLFR